MAYKLTLKPNQPEGITLDQYRSRFLEIGFQFNPERPEIGSSGKRDGIVVFQECSEAKMPQAKIMLGLSTLGWDAAEIRPLVEKWAKIAAETQSDLWDGDNRVAADDANSLIACASRIASGRQAICKGSTHTLVRALEEGSSEA